jgi:hypothetical protein
MIMAAPVFIGETSFALWLLIGRNALSRGDAESTE